MAKAEARPEKRWQTTVVMHPGDWELLEYIVAQIGCSRSEAIRTAVRAYAGQLTKMTNLK